MTWAGRAAHVVVAASTLLAIYEIPEWRLSLVILAATSAVASWLTHDLWTQITLGFVGGALAGLVILGPGWRVVMRVVAIMDRAQDPEFSIGGTTLMILIGALIGGLMGIVGNLIRNAASIRSTLVSGIALGLVTTVSLLVRFTEDLNTLGHGVWINLIMFGTVSILYGIPAIGLVDRLGSRMRWVSVTARSG